MAKQIVGIVGLGVMGENLALNLESKGFSTAGFDLDDSKVKSFAAKTAAKQAVAAHSLAELVASLQSPRRILMMVPAGKPVDAVLTSLRPLLAKGDLVIDGGNSHYLDTARRITELAPTGILYLGVGISGGEEGALHGPSIMPGGDPEGWPIAKPLLQAIAAKAADGTPCCDWIGSGGAGHFVKMVHNGIEYADMQMICEAYGLMTKVLGMTAAESSRAFAQWNQGELENFLVSITAEILARTDQETGKPMVEVILDEAEQKGTGRWTAEAALDLGVPAPTIAEAVFTRTLAALKDERIAASRVLAGPTTSWTGDRAAALDRIGKALMCAKICAYAQGFHILRRAEEQLHWSFRYGTIASLWRAGCIIRAQFLGKIKEAYDRDGNLANLLLDPYFAEVVNRHQETLRHVVALAIQHGAPVPAFASTLAYYDGYRSATLPANLLQAQRDFFGAHTYRRVDKPGTFHTDWQS